MTSISLLLPLLTVLARQPAAPEISADKPVPKPPKHEISLEFVDRRPDVVAVETVEGFPLTLRLSGNNDLGIGMRCRELSDFPLNGNSGWLVFSDPDGCWSWTNPDCLTADERMLEFTVDGDAAGVPDGAGDNGRRAALTEWGGGGKPSGIGWDQNAFAWGTTTYGPPTGGTDDALVSSCVSLLTCGYPSRPCTSNADCSDDETCQQMPAVTDGFGYGADDDLPGLVLLSDTGVGVVRTDGYDPVVPRQARNLAGFLTAVSYDLSDKTARTVIDAHLVVPPGGLFLPVVQYDNCTGTPGCECMGTEPALACTEQMARVEAGAVQTLTQEQLHEQVEQWVVTVRAFVVNGTAPSVLADLDGDGIVGAHDAEMAGYSLLSDEETTRFRHVQSFWSGIEIPWDYDGNGIRPPVLPATIGSLTKIPR